MLSPFKNAVTPAGLESPQIRKKWDNKKSLTRFKYAVFATVLILIGLELSSPSYSMTTSLVEHVASKSETFRAIIENNYFQGIFIKEFDADKQLPIYSGKSVKFTIFFIIFFLVSIHFLSNDPLSNSELLRNLVKKSNKCRSPYLFFLFPEITYYAKELPSNRVPEICASCGTDGCPNRLSYGDKSKTFFWNGIFAKLSPSLTNSILYTTHKCRNIFFLRYSLWLSAIILIVVYILARAVDWYVTGTVNPNLILIAYIILLFLFGFVIGAFNSTRNENARGVWGQFSEIVSNLFHSDHFKEIYVRVACGHNRREYEFTDKNHERKSVTSGQEIQRLLTLINYLDSVVMKKILRALKNESQIQSINDKSSLRTILVSLMEMLYVLNQKEIDFRCALFVEDADQKCLAPLVSVPFKGQQFFTLDKKDQLSEKLAIDSDSIASRVWQSRRTLSASVDNISYFREEQKKYLKSMIAIPLLAEKEARVLLAEKGININEIIGVLTIDCNDENYFTRDTQETNLIEIMPFVNRLLFEMLYSVSNRGESNEQS